VKAYRSLLIGGVCCLNSLTVEAGEVTLGPELAGVWGHAITTRDLRLFSAASADSQLITFLLRGHKVQVHQREGAWYQVRVADGTSGWLRVVYLRFQASSKDPTQADHQARARALSRLLDGASVKAHDTSIARGLAASSLAPEQGGGPEQLQKAAQYIPSPAVLTEFARQGKLR